MIQIKKVVLGLLILYVSFFSFLFISQSYKFNKLMNQEIEIETKEYYEKFVNESRSKVQNYRILSTNSEQIKCLDEVEKMIDFSYKKQHPKATNYVGLMNEYYNKPEEERFYNLSNVLHFCKLRRNTANLDNIFASVMGNIAIIEENFMNSNNKYQISFEFGFVFKEYEISQQAIDKLKSKNKMSLRDQVIRNEIVLIEEVLELVGEDYE